MPHRSSTTSHRSSRDKQKPVRSNVYRQIERPFLRHSQSRLKQNANQVLHFTRNRACQARTNALHPGVLSRSNPLWSHQRSLKIPQSLSEVSLAQRRPSDFSNHQARKVLEPGDARPSADPIIVSESTPEDWIDVSLPSIS